MLDDVWQRLNSDKRDNAASASEIDESSDTLNLLSLNLFSLNIIYLPIKQTKWIRHKVNKLMKSSPNYNLLQ